MIMRGVPFFCPCSVIEHVYRNKRTCFSSQPFPKPSNIKELNIKMLLHKNTAVKSKPEKHENTSNISRHICFRGTTHFLDSPKPQSQPGTSSRASSTSPVPLDLGIGKVNMEITGAVEVKTYRSPQKPISPSRPSPFFFQSETINSPESMNFAN